MTYREAEATLTKDLKKLYGAREASQLSAWVLEEISGKKKSERLIAASQEMSAEEIQRWKAIKDRLMLYEPIQYVLNQAPFMEWVFFADSSTLIPRPETEELVAWVLSDHNSEEPLKVLDVGTGSGCIAIALQLKRPNWRVIGGDISLAALETAEMNAQKYGAKVQLAPLNILGSLASFKPQNFNLIVSNPPYIPLSEQNIMSYHVTGYEPKDALFVPDEQPLLFYEALGKAGLRHLAPGGMLYVETHQNFGTAVVELFDQMGYTSILRKDLQGNDRMVRAVKN